MTFLNPNFVHNKIKYNQCRTTVQHWQLRDLVCPSSDPDEVYLVYGNNLQTFNLKSQKVHTVLQFDFLPASFTVKNGFLAAGGQDSQLLVKDLKNNRIIVNANIGGSINNACHISSFSENSTHSNRLLVSNNDHTVKVYSLPSFENITFINMNVPVNYCATSSDGNTLAAVGDNNYVMLYDVRSSYTQIAKMKEYYDGGFACDFNLEGTQVAAGSQDGTVVVWDLRTRKVMKKLRSKQKSQGGATRALKYSKTPLVDLLLFTEHVSYFHAIDTRTLAEHQILKISPSEKNISGIGFSSDGKRVFVGLEEGLVSYDVNMVTRRTFAKGSFL